MISYKYFEPTLLTQYKYIAAVLICCTLAELIKNGAENNQSAHHLYYLMNWIMYAPIIFMYKSREYFSAMVLIIVHSLTHIIISNNTYNLLYNSFIDILVHEATLIYFHIYFKSSIVCSKLRACKYIYNIGIVLVHVGNIICAICSLPFVTSYDLNIFRISTWAPAVSSFLFIGTLLSNKKNANFMILFTFLYTVLMYTIMAIDETKVDYLLDCKFFEAYFACACVIGFFENQKYSIKDKKD
jgi:hypothetical protein